MKHERALMNFKGGAHPQTINTEKEINCQEVSMEIQILLALIKGSTYPGNVSQVEQVVYLGWCRKHFSDDGVVDVNGGLKETHNKINIGTQ